MNLRARLKALQKRCPQPRLRMTHEERCRRMQELLGYNGSDPDKLDRKARLIALLQKWRQEGRI